MAQFVSVARYVAPSKSSFPSKTLETLPKRFANAGVSLTATAVYRLISVAKRVCPAGGPGMGRFLFAGMGMMERISLRYFSGK